MTQDERYGILAALSETLLPADDGPGGAEARVADYVKGVLDRRSAQDRARIESGLQLIDSMTRQRYGKAFEDCEGEEHSEILKQLQQVPHQIVRSFFSKLLDLAIEGYLCDPSHGGNHDGAGWRAIGYSRELRR